MSGTPSNPILPVGTSCGTNQMCNAAGMCVGCIMDSDCPMPSNECQTRVCNSGTCGFNPVAQGTLVSAQVPGDCHRDVCNGAGAVVDEIDNTDLPSNGGNMCVQRLCTAGVPSTPAFAQGTACTGPNNATMCNGSETAPACVECMNASTCPGGPDSQCHAVTCDLGRVRDLLPARGHGGLAAALR